MNKYKLLREDFKKDWIVDENNEITESFLIRYFIDSANKVPGNNKSFDNKGDRDWAYNQITKCVDSGYIEPTEGSVFRYLNLKFPKIQFKFNLIVFLTVLSTIFSGLQLLFAILDYLKK